MQEPQYELDYDAFLDRILTLYYSDESGIKEFKKDVLEHYGIQHEQTFDYLMEKHANLLPYQQLEEVLGEFVKII